MTYDDIARKLVENEAGVEHSTLMKGPCLRYKGDFIAAMFAPENAMIIKVSAQRVNELIASGEGREFNFTKKRFKEWVLIPATLEKQYEKYLREALAYAKQRK